MDPIYVYRRKLSFKAKVAICIAVFVFICSLYFSIKSTNNTDEFTKLKLSKTMEAPQCANSGGFNKTSFYLTLFTDNKNSKIYYTLDGSEPDLKSELYQAPIKIEDRSDERGDLSLIPTSPRWKPPLSNVYKGTVIRAICVNNKMNKSTELIRTFFISEKGSLRYSIPVVSITINKDDFFGYKEGIYVPGKTYWDKDNYIKRAIDLDIPWWEYPSNYLERGKDFERKAYLEYFDNGGKGKFESEVKIRINGNATRGFPQKSLRVLFDQKDGSAVPEYGLFSADKKSPVHSIILRNGGNDWNKTMFRDGLIQSIMRNADIEIQQYKPVVVFINGEYWGIHEIRERIDQDFLGNKYNISKDSIAILEGISNVYSGNSSVKNEFDDLLSFVRNNDMSKQENFEYLKKKIDLNSFIDIIIANVYFCNNDWPGNNVRFWRFMGSSQDSTQNKYRDGKWRWILNDTDWGMGFTGEESYKYNLLIKAQKLGSVGVLFSGLLKNSSFKAIFVERFKGYLTSILQPDKVIFKVDSVKNILNPEMEEHICRWRMMDSKKDWDENVNELKKFSKQRYPVQIDQLNNFFELKGSEKLQVQNP